ncbi:hypothetical protein STEG23_012166, partial [Scotinomys teguina]
FMSTKQTLICDVGTSNTWLSLMFVDVRCPLGIGFQESVRGTVKQKMATENGSVSDVGYLNTSICDATAMVFSFISDAMAMVFSFIRDAMAMVFSFIRDATAMVFSLVSDATAMVSLHSNRTLTKTGLLFLAILVLLIHLSLARATPVSRPAHCLDHSKNLLRTTKHMLEKARQTLKHYPCTAEDIDHEDITGGKSSTLKACLPLELAKNESCLASAETSSITTLCLSSIYEDLKMYGTEFKAINAELLDQNQKQILLDENMLTAIDELMQALDLNGEIPPQKPSLEEADPYKVKVKLCILLQAFSIRAVTINRVMSYLNAS